MTVQRPSRMKPPRDKHKPPKPPHQTVGLWLPTALMERLATFENQRGYRVNLSALFIATLERWLTENES